MNADNPILQYDEIEDYLSTLNINKKLLFRGESSFYPTCLPPLFREKEEFQIALLRVITNLAIHIYDKYLKRKLKNIYGFILFNNAPFGANNILNPEDLEPRHTIRGLEGIMQHYGFPTNWVDLTFHLETAKYFASQQSDSEIGYLYYSDSLTFNDGVLIDVGQFAADLRIVIPFLQTRPELQHGLAFRPYSYNKCIRHLFKVVKFRKENTQSSVETTEFFPKDGLHTWLMGNVVDYYFDFIERYKSFYKTESVPEDNSLKESLEYVISKFGLW